MRHNLTSIINLEFAPASRIDDRSHVPTVRQRRARDLVATRLALELAVISDDELCTAASLEHAPTNQTQLFTPTGVCVAARRPRLFNQLAIVPHVVFVAARVLELTAGVCADLLVVARVTEATADHLGFA